MASTYDLKTASVIIGTAPGLAVGTTSFGIGRVPKGKKRFVTFVKAVNLWYGAGATNTLYLAQHTASTTALLAEATAGQKMAIPFRIGEHDDTRQVPGGSPDITKPLFAITASNFLIGCASRERVDTFVQYYDE